MRTPKNEKRKLSRGIRRPILLPPPLSVAATAPASARIACSIPSPYRWSRSTGCDLSGERRSESVQANVQQRNRRGDLPESWRFTRRSAEISAKVMPPTKQTIVVGISPAATVEHVRQQFADGRAKLCTYVSAPPPRPSFVARRMLLRAALGRAPPRRATRSGSSGLETRSRSPLRRAPSRSEQAECSEGRIPRRRRTGLAGSVRRRRRR